MKRLFSGLLACALLSTLGGLGGGRAQERPTLPKSLDSSKNLAVLKIPHITDVHQHLFGMPPLEIDVVGTNFGTTQGTRKVTLDGTAATHYLHWGDTGITITPPFALVFWDHVYQVAIVSGTHVLSNIFSKRFLWDFDGMTPKEGPVGTEVLINVYRLPASPGGLVLKIGAVDFPIITWTPAGTGSFGKIKARVPSGVSLGDQKVYLQKAGQVASEVYTFKVILPTIPPPKVPVKKLEGGGILQ